MAEDKEGVRIVITATARKGVSPELVKEKLLKLYDALNEYCVLKYGKSLTVESFERFVVEELEDNKEQP